VKIIAAATPFAPAAATTSGTLAGGEVITATSGTDASSSMRATQGMPSISVWRGLTRSMRPGKRAARRLRSTARPTDPSRGLAPTSAIARGANSLSRR
jgi:hypothetical protein